jgi:hypothetical protein
MDVTASLCGQSFYIKVPAVPRKLGGGGWDHRLEVGTKCDLDEWLQDILNYLKSCDLVRSRLKEW